MRHYVKISYTGRTLQQSVLDEECRPPQSPQSHSCDVTNENGTMWIRFNPGAGQPRAARTESSTGQAQGQLCHDGCYVHVVVVLQTQWK